MSERFAFFLSVVLHPLLLPTYIFGILFALAPEVAGLSALSFSARGSLLLLLFLNTFVAPAVVIYYLHRLGIVRSLQLQDLRDRRIPYLSTVIIYVLSTYLFGWQFQPISELAPQIAVVLGSITVALIVVALVSLRWQISAHATGMGGCLGALGGVILKFGDYSLFLSLVVCIIVTGLLLSARLRLNAHTPSQVVAGLAVGLTASMGAVFLYF